MTEHSTDPGDGRVPTELAGVDGSTADARTEESAATPAVPFTRSPVRPSAGPPAEAPVGPSGGPSAEAPAPGDAPPAAESDPRALESTGDERVDTALAVLDRLDRAPIVEHVAIYDEVQRRLHDVLADVDGEDSA